MVTNIVLSNTVSVGVNNGYCMINGEKTSIKDIPIIRFRLNQYGEDELRYINKVRKDFKYSAALVEIDITNMQDDILEVIDSIRENLVNVAIYLYIDITDDSIDSGISDIIGYVSMLNGVAVDRVMLKDKTTKLGTQTAITFRRSISQAMGRREIDVGICSSPLSFGDEACITAMRARDIIARYCEIDGCAIPSAKHQCMDTCGCMRHIIIDKDIPAPVGKSSNGGSGKKSSATKKGNNTSNVSRKPKMSKAPMEWI